MKKIMILLSTSPYRIRVSTNLLLANSNWPSPDVQSTKMTSWTSSSATPRLAQPQPTLLQQAVATSHPSLQSVRAVETAKSDAQHQEKLGNGILFGITIPLFAIFFIVAILIRQHWTLKRRARKARRMSVQNLGRSVSAGTLTRVGTPETTLTVSPDGGIELGPMPTPLPAVHIARSSDWDARTLVDQ